MHDLGVADFGIQFEHPCCTPISAERTVEQLGGRLK
jgi:hypothetical protein